MSAAGPRFVLWQNPFDRSTEWCRVSVSETGLALAGLVLAPVEEEPGRVEYRVESDADWATGRAQLHIETPRGSRACELRREGERWWLDGRHEPSLDGCTDVDLRVTPATNTLPIRRLGLEVGASAEVRAAWVGFPGLEILPSEQSYERLSEDVYRYRSGDFTADLRVDDAGVVLRYGDDYWRAIAAS
jgi:uncharacterized protein